MKIILAWTIITSSVVLAVSNYQQCFECFFLYRNGYYFCQNTGECLPTSWAGCSTKNQVTSLTSCPVAVYEECPNYTFTNETLEMAEPVLV